MKQQRPRMAIMEHIGLENLSQHPSRGAFLLQPLGVTPDQEALYRLLLRQRGASKDLLSELTGKSPRSVEQLLRQLRSLGLVSQAPGERGTYFAVRPSQALEVLYLQKHEELRQARAAIEQIIEESKVLPSAVDPINMVEVVVGWEAISQHFVQLQLSAEHEVLLFDTPPYAATVEETVLTQNSVEVELLKRGISYRTVYDRSALEYPGQMAQLMEIVTLGEEARLTHSLPMRLAIADRKMALIPLVLTATSDQQHGDIVIHPSPLLEALVALFERVWDEATPIKLDHPSSEILNELEAPVSLSERELLLLLSADVKEDVIARQLGVSRSTVQRRTRVLMERFEAQTRLQLVLSAARRGLI